MFSRLGILNEESKNIAAGERHATPTDLDVHTGTSRLSFAFVRHPLSWYQSFFAWNCLEKWRDINVMRVEPFPKVYMLGDFEDFLKLMVESRPGFLTKLYKKYLGNTMDDLDFVGRQEFLNHDLYRILEESGQEFSRHKFFSARVDPRRSKISRASPMPEYQKPMADKIMELEHEIVERFYK